MPKGKHLTLDDRRSIQIGLNEGNTFKDIARHIGKDPSTISKEVRSHAFSRRNNTFNSCVYFARCKHRRDLCRRCTGSWDGICKKCIDVDCYSKCPDFKLNTCRKLLSAPYVCNGCPGRTGCHPERHLYSAKAAQKAYEETLSQCRQGFAISYDELKRISAFSA